MGTDILTIDGTRSLGLWQVLEERQRRGDEMSRTLPRRQRFAAETILDEFVSLLRANPKVWAVYATEDPSGITVWTYVDSIDRDDLLPVYEAEWQLLNMFPEVGFDFNTATLPVGQEQFDIGENAHLYRL